MIAELVNKEQTAGYYSIDVNTHAIKNISSGIYFYRITAITNTGSEFINVKKMIILK